MLRTLFSVRFSFLWMMLVGTLVGSSVVLPQYTALGATPPLDATFEQAVRAATIRHVPTAEGAQLFISPINQVNTWVFGSSSIVRDDPENPPEMLLFLAEYRDQQWRVAFELTPGFHEAMARVPRDLLTPEQRATLGFGTMPQGDGSMQLSLPWATGETQWLTSGPHDGTRSAIDFSGGSGVVRAAREGVAYRPCGNASPYVRIDHGNGLTTHYFHLQSISVANGQSVSRGAAIGRHGALTGDQCLSGPATGAHVHFWIQVNKVSIPISGIDIGGWTVSASTGDRNGCLTRVRDGLRKCYPGNQEIYNDGTIGTGITPSKMDINGPGNGASVAGQFDISGWAIHEGAASGTGVNEVHIYFDGQVGSGARSVAATYGIRRDDVANVYGDRYRNSGYSFTLKSSELSIGQHTIYVYAHSTLTNQWQMMSRTFNIVNAPPNMVTVATPAQGATVTGPNVTFQWNDPGDFDNRPRNYRDYTIEIKDSSGLWKTLMPWTATNSWTATLVDGTYTWRILTGDGADGSAWSNELTFTVSSSLPKPSNFQGSVTDDGIRLTWRDNATNELGHRVYRWRGEDLTWVLIGELPGTTFTDANVKCGVTYFYLVSAYNAVAESEQEGWIDITMPNCPPPGKVPDAWSLTDTDIAVLFWEPATGDVEGYNIYQLYIFGGGYASNLVASTIGNTTDSVTIPGLLCEFPYKFHITAYNSAGESEPFEVSATTKECPLLIPTGLRTLAVDETWVLLGWQDNNFIEQGHIVYRWDSYGGFWEEIGTVGSSYPYFTDTDLACGTTYYYEVKAYLGDKISDSDGWITVRTLDCGSTTSSPTPQPTAQPQPTATPVAQKKHSVFMPFVRRSP